MLLTTRTACELSRTVLFDVALGPWEGIREAVILLNCSSVFLSQASNLVVDYF